ncbi:hypothetical protein BDDG_03013 [Blastomyces dermatitidis ATCC 18188]|uniref:Uncharacterized protein n=1 Tax=Ajellomyces dermatitidis (strain ATCC 18188 / CBS 674.68) TaxID=653446 RepID=F2TA09_AJEDA|nr:hypothetical protein BDDG_03013 [Blastomyces dermatitidis ATCC 18188]EQL29337.1 hypothetical protein BDFG_08060 [Blastomyces dermatitidis ATCC 26199]
MTPAVMLRISTHCHPRSAKGSLAQELRKDHPGSNYPFMDEYGHVFEISSSRWHGKPDQGCRF